LTVLFPFFAHYKVFFRGVLISISDVCFLLQVAWLFLGCSLSLLLPPITFPPQPNISTIYYAGDLPPFSSRAPFFCHRRGSFEILQAARATQPFLKFFLPLFQGLLGWLRGSLFGALSFVQACPQFFGQVGSALLPPCPSPFFPFFPLRTLGPWVPHLFP